MTLASQSLCPVSTTSDDRCLPKKLQMCRWISNTCNDTVSCTPYAVLGNLSEATALIVASVLATVFGASELSKPTTSGISQPFLDELGLGSKLPMANLNRRGAGECIAQKQGYVDLVSQ